MIPGQILFCCAIMGTLRFNAIFIKTAVTLFFAETEESTLKFTWNLTEPQIAKTILYEENKVTLSDFKLSTKL